MRSGLSGYLVLAGVGVSGVLLFVAAMLARRLLAVSAILLALQLVLGATGGESTEPVTDPVGDGPQLTLPLALPGDHLATGDEVDVYLAGRATPLATGARVTETSPTTSPGRPDGFSVRRTSRPGRSRASSR